MTDFLFVKFLHVVGLAYWLGGDLGVFYSSYIVSDETKAPIVRTAAAKMLFALDQAPRICMTLMLPLGLHLAWIRGVFGFGSAAMIAIWFIAFAWTATVVFLHVGSNKTAKSLLTGLDYWFRVIVAIMLIGVGITALTTGAIALPYWVAIKLAIFGGLIACGLMVRIVLKDFGPAFAKLASGQPSAADNAAIQRSLGRTRPIVVCIWIGLLVSTALGLHLI